MITLAVYGFLIATEQTVASEGIVLLTVAYDLFMASAIGCDCGD